MKIILLVILVSLCAMTLSAQDGESADLQYLTDDLSQPDGDFEELHENLAQILSTPFNLNTVTREDLQLLHVLTDSQIANFLAYRTQHGPLADVHELQAIAGFDAGSVRRVMPLVRVTDPATVVDKSLIKRMLSNNNTYVVSRYERTLQKKKGYISSPDSAQSYSGSPGKVYFRYRSSQPGDFSVGFTGEKDAGEKFLLRPGDNHWGFDFSSWHIQLRNKGRIRNMIAGDFQAQFGQGLITGGAFGLGKGAESTTTTRRSNVGFLPYTSINEGAYLRGVAVSLDLLRNTFLSFFYSRAKRDAATDSLTDGAVVRSVLTTGYHRTPIELANRKAVLEHNSGIVAACHQANLDAGIQVNLTAFGMPIRREETRYNQHAFAGKQNLNCGVFLNYTVANISFFSEAAKSVGAGSAFVIGALASLHPRLEIALLHRDYMPDYHTFYANAFSENTQPQNEQGTYWGWRYRLTRQLTFTGYVDLFKFPWLGFRRYRPSTGHEWLMRGHYQPSKSVALFMLFRQESKERNLPSEPLYRVATGTKRNLVVHCDYGILEKLRFKARVQYNTFRHGKAWTEGLVAMVDASFDMGRFRLTGRHAIFDTDHYDNRQYVFENDAWLSYALPAYSGAGVRNYVLMELKVHKQLTLWIRYASTRLTDVSQIGTGPELIAGNTKNDVKFQARLTF